MWGNGAEPTIVCVEFRMKYCHESLRTVVLPLCSVTVVLYWKVSALEVWVVLWFTARMKAALLAVWNCLWCSGPETFSMQPVATSGFPLLIVLFRCPVLTVCRSQCRGVTKAAFFHEHSTFSSKQWCSVTQVLYITAVFVALYCPQTASQLSWNTFS